MQVPILIVGAGPAGLASSILLSRLGVRSLVIERHSSTSIHPKATAISTRSMEIFRAWGIEPRIRAIAIDAQFTSSIRRDLRGPEVERRSLGFPSRDEASVFSPTSPAALAQNELEPILLDHARSHAGADIRFATELVDFEQHPGGIHATIRDRSTGEELHVDARYLIAADGASSPVRQRLGIANKGAENIGEYLSIRFRADIDGIVGPDRCGLYMLEGLGGPAPSVVLPTDNNGSWLIATPWRSDARPVASLSPDDLVSIVRRAAGDPLLAVDVRDHQLVGIGAAVAERFRVANVFLVGDSAHRTAPTGGTGMNTAIQSAHNLAWKLAHALNGVAGDALLDTYEVERRPSGERNVLRSLGRLPDVSGVAADLGVVYTSAAIVADDAEHRPAVIEPTARAEVGSRLPHAWLHDGHRIRSTLDLTNDRLMLVTGPAGTPWRTAVSTVGQRLGLSLGVAVIDPSADAGALNSWLRATGIEADGAVLVRPDGHIAWRSVSAAADATATLEHVAARVLCFDHDAHGTARSTDDRRSA